MSSASLRSSRIVVAAVVLGGVGVAMRVYNAFAFDVFWGFDAPENWRYIARLTRSWALPAPDADWSTAHPPLFYYLDAAVLRLLRPTGDLRVVLLRLLGSLEGLVIVLLAVLLVRRLAPADDRRALIAGALLLFLPVHVYMSAMLSEELLVSALVSAVVVGLCLELRQPRPGGGLARAALLGLAAGLAWLTKLTGVLVVVVGAGAYLIDGWRRREPGRGLSRAAALAGVALLVGGWFYARNWIEYGYLYPHGLPAHEKMFTMPPGERGLADYLSLPWATFLDPQVMQPDLLRSVWGTTYASIWFDAHRHFLPRERVWVNVAGTLILTLALLPTLAFAIGAARGMHRALRSPGGADTVLLGLVVLTLAGYVLFTWRNPWFAVVKGSFLLGLSVPFAVYASEVLAEWTRKRRLVSVPVWLLLVALLLGVVLSFTHLEVFWSNDHMPQPGTAWWRHRLDPSP